MTNGLHKTPTLMNQYSFPNIKPQRLAIKLTSNAEKMLKQGHPWIFSESVIKINKTGNAGDVAIIFSQKDNQVIGVGLYDPDSPIQIKMLENSGGVIVNQDFFSKKTKTAFSKREQLLQTDTTSYRLLFGENDGFPGFIADVYEDVLVIKLYSAIWFPYLKEILEELIAVSQSKCVVLRLSRNLQENNQYGFQDGAILFGSLENEVVVFKEHGIYFSANVIKGHKTGYFLDHRHNRKKVGSLSKNKSVLDVFSYAGGFSVHALANGAREVTSIDISQQALQMAKENALLNQFSGTHLTIAGDAFEVLNSLIAEGKTYDLVVIDPPSFAKRKAEVNLAKKKYAQLAMLGAALTSKKGILVLASCSSRISKEDFFEINRISLSKSQRKFRLIEKTQHDIDHPISFQEGAYLKCAYYEVY